ncbi:hypothetical protein F4821DRAFT_221926 [Hypoxylon rubiginosum]|uniref:Uncharacterized protein n=1 Tax=Hypoxylon rubiginosum TaxID=110542 RepID=A0ACC0DMG5_9PEZI|nr:hypothetical protein F4821DRAFT_221926 [Hypoxylon rubiginosum]
MSDVESDDGKRASKKRKASRACDRCNSQHQPCDNAVPKCSVCVRAGTECTYNRPVRKRGPRSGYTGQNGERLWAIILQAKPELEDVVLQVLRGGTYGSTGVPNLDYFKNNDNQAELVNRFNDSRLGRFLQNGETPDLLLPSLDQHVSPIISQIRSEMGFGQSSIPHRQSNLVRGMSDRSIRSTSSAPQVNPHGAPQDPGDIYIQSEDIRKRVFQPLQNSLQPYHPDFSGDTPYGSNGSIDGYGTSQRTSEHRASEKTIGISTSVGMSQQSQHHDLNHSVPLDHENGELHLEETSRWLDSTPFDTLRNLGFAPGESMAEDFLELCENADPINHTPVASGDQDEDEEAVWRRLVMRGRFI